MTDWTQLGAALGPFLLIFFLLYADSVRRMHRLDDAILAADPTVDDLDALTDMVIALEQSLDDVHGNTAAWMQAGLLGTVVGLAALFGQASAASLGPQELLQRGLGLGLVSTIIGIVGGQVVRWTASAAMRDAERALARVQTRLSLVLLRRALHPAGRAPERLEVAS